MTVTADRAASRLEALLAEREWVRALAARLLRDDASRDDMEQQVWLAALKAPPAETIAPRAWLAGVVRNWARRGFRDEARRRRRETAGARPEAQTQASAEDMVARADAHRHVVNAVFALGEPYRSTVLARYFEDLPPREIARRMGVPVETVRTRLKRALAQLRSRLDSDYGRAGRSWGVALLPLAAKGGLVVKASTKATLVAGALLLFAAGAAIWHAQAKEDAQSDPVSIPSRVETSAAPAPRPARVAPRDEEPVAPAGTASVRGEVWFEAPQRPAPSVVVEIGPPGASRSVRTDEAGRFRLGGLAAGFRGSVRVRTKGAGEVVRPVTPLREGEERDVGLLRLAAAAAVDVAVLTFDQAPVEDAEVEAWRTPDRMITQPTVDASQWRDAPDPAAHGRTDAQGRFRFEDLEADTWTFRARKSGMIAATSIAVPLAAGSVGGPVRIRLGRGYALSGRVVDREGRGVPDVVVWAQTRSGYEHMEAKGAMPHATTAVDGGFAIDGLAAGSFDVRVQRRGSQPITAAKVRVPTGAPIELRLGGRRVVGTVREAGSGAPVPGALVSATAGELFNVIDSVSDAAGRFVLDTVIDVELISGIHATKLGFVEVPDPIRNKDPDIDPGLWLRRQGDTPLELVLRRGARLVGRVTLEDEPVRGAQVIVHRPRAHAPETTTDKDGRYVVDGIERGPALVQVVTADLQQKGWDSERASAFRMRGVLADCLQIPETGEVEFDVAMEGGIVVEGRVTDPGGAPAAGALVTGNNLSRVATGADGRFRIVASLVRNRVFVHVQDPNVGWGSLDAAVPATRAIANAEIKLKPFPRLRGRVTGSEELHGAWIQWTSKPQGDFEAWWGNARPQPVAADGTFDVAVFQVDALLVRVGAEGVSTVTAPATKEDDGSFVAEVRLESGARFSGRAVAARTRAPIAGAEVLLLELTGGAARTIRTGSRFPDVVAAVTGADGRFVVEEVRRGTRLVRVQAEGFVAVEREVDVPVAGEFVVELERGQAISGSVLFSDGTPLVRGSLSASRQVDDARFAGGKGQNYFGFAKTDEAGHYTIDFLPPGTFDLLVSQGLSQEQFANAERQGVTAGSQGVDFVVERKGAGLRLRGRVVAADGTAVGRARVSAEPSIGNAWVQDDGTFEMEGLEAIAYSVRAAAPPGTRFLDFGVSYGARFLDGKVDAVRPPRDDVVLTLPLGETIEGVVVDASGAPVPHVWVSIGLPVDFSAPTARAFGGPLADDTDAEGHFEITGLRPGGAYRLIAIGSRGMRDPVPLLGGESVAPGTHGLRLTLGTFMKIKGVVVDATGTPVAGASVAAFGPRGSEHAAKTDAAGSFTIDALDGGSRFDVTAWTVTLAPTTRFSVTAGAEGLRLELHEGRRISGRALAKDGSPLALTRLVFRASGCPVPVEVTTDREGRFEGRGLLDVAVGSPGTELEFAL